MKITPLKMRRVSKGLDVVDTYEALEISKSTFYKIEQGHGMPSVRLIARMAKLFDCSIDEIYKDLGITG